MTQQKRPTLRRYLSSRILFTVSLMFLLLTAIELLLANWLDRKDLRENLNRSTEVYASSVDQFLTSLNQQIISISQNSIVVNALIDFNGREDYLPLYLEAISIYGRTDIGVQLVDFQGELIESNFNGRQLAFIDREQWLDKLFTDNESWVSWRSEGAYFAQPVLNRGLAEGAILVFVSAEILSDGLANINPGFDHQLSSLNDETIYQKYINSAPERRQNQIFGETKQLNNHPLQVQLSIQKASFSLPSNTFLPIILVSLALIAVAIVSMLNMSIRRINEVLSNLQVAIRQVIQSQDLTARVATQSSPKELAELGDLFNLMVAKLQATTTSRDEINSIVQSMGEAVFVCDLDFKITLSNQEFSTQQSVAEIIGATKEHSIFTNQADFIEHEQVTEAKTLLWRRRPLLVEQKKQGWVFTGADITDIRSAEQQMLLMQKAIDSSSNGIIIVDATSRAEPIVFANSSFSEITGFSREEVLGRRCDFLQGSATDALTRMKIKKGLIEHKPILVEILNYRKNGEPFWNRLAIDPVFNEAGEATHFLGVLTDISAEVGAREELRIAKEAAEKAVKAKAEFLAMMSHEIRTPMNGVLGMLGVLLNTGLNDEQRHRARIAQSSAQSLLVLINDILDFSKIEAGKLELEAIAFNPRHMFGELAEVLAHQAQDKGLELVLDVTGIEASKILGDPGRIRQIVTNLISNAIKFTHEGEILIQIGLFQEQDHWRMIGRVVDTGIGIPEEKTAKLFDSFSQVDASTTREYGGTGLGLAIVKHLCELMDGNIRVMSEVGRGSVFEFELSVGIVEGWHAVVPPIDIAEKRILIIDHNQTNLDVLRGQFKHWGAQVEYALNVEDAKTLLKAKRITPQRMFDLAIVDLLLPDQGALTLAEFFRADDAFGDIKLVGMSAIGEFSPAHIQNSYQFDAYFPKPATTEDMFNALMVLSADADKQANKARLLTRLEQHQHTLANFSHQANQGVLSKILIVDDNPINQEVAVGILDGFGLSAERAADGQKALEKMRIAPEAEPYTFILMDCQMPVMDGYEASQKIRQGFAGERYMNTPILAMTANAMAGDRERCLAAGMSDYIAKPVDPMLLNQKLRQWVLNSETEDDEVNSSEHLTHSPKIQSQEPSKNQADAPAAEQSEQWQPELLLKRIGNNEALLSKLLNLYLKEQGQRMQDLERALVQADYPQMQAIAHTIKGVCANLAAHDTQDAAALLEASLKTGDHNGLAEQVSELKQAEVALVAAFNSYLQQDTNAADEQAQSLSQEELTKLLLPLYESIRQREFIDAEQYPQLKQRQQDDQLQQQFAKLIELIEQFENDAAQSLIESIAQQQRISLTVE